jgi:hypothetical protein
MLLEENLEIRLRENPNKWDSLWSTKTAKIKWENHQQQKSGK